MNLNNMNLNNINNNDNNMNLNNIDFEGYNSNKNNYAEYENIIINKNNDCYEDRNIYITKKNKNKCNIDYSNKKINKELELNFNNYNNKHNKCKKIFLENDVNNSNNNKNLYSNKHNKILTKRIINTIPYRNYKNYEYNPELELYIKNGLYNSMGKSVNNISEIKKTKYPLMNKLKNIIKNKSEYIILDRFELSTRQLKGSKVYLNKYKKDLKNIKNIIN